MPKPRFHYTRTQVVLHWTIAVLLIGLILTHEEYLAAREALGHSLPLTVGQTAINGLHIWGGSLVLPLALWRLFSRVRYGVPAPPAREPRTLRAFASAVHVLLYVLIFAMPISGVSSYFNIFPRLSTAVHIAGKAALLVLVLVHMTGALVHHFIWKTDVLRRMMGSRVDSGQ
jgi:cytochrome b561